MNALIAQAALSFDRLRTADASATIAALRNVVRNPTANTGFSLVVLVFVALAVLLLVLFVLMLITPSRRQVVKVRRYVGGAPPGASAAAGAGSDPVAGDPPPRGQSGERKPPSDLFLALTGPIAVTVLVVLALVGTYLATSTDVYCAKTCHNSSAIAKKAVDIDHAACVSCHEQRGIFGILANASSRARMLVYYGLGRSPRKYSVAVDSVACLGCHGAVEGETVASKTGIRMSHKEVIEAGQPCAACHQATGHSKDAFTASMSTCLPCHDAKIASATCTTCHVKDPGTTVVATGETIEGMGSGMLVYPAVRAANRRCGSCHDQERECDTCHGIRMPHSNDFIEGAHARSAAFTGKIKCWRCHDPQFCSSGCHAAFSPDGTRSGHAGDNWVQLHKRQEWSGGCICHSQRGRRTGSMCYLCHQKNGTLLPIRQ